MVNVIHDCWLNHVVKQRNASHERISSHLAMPSVVTAVGQGGVEDHCSSSFTRVSRVDDIASTEIGVQLPALGECCAGASPNGGCGKYSCDLKGIT